LPQGYIQNAVPFHAYRDGVTAGRLAVTRGFALSDEDRLRRHVIERLMCDLHVDLAAAARLYGRPADHFAPELARLAGMARDGIVEIAGHTLTVPEPARPLLRLPAAVFDAYLPASGAAHAKAV
jgi:oxygen-independent coproporphyrinogen-3 oxidase